MPYYKITVTDANGKLYAGIKEDALADIEAYYQKAHRRAVLKLGGLLKKVEVVMLCSHSDELRAFLEAEKRKQFQAAQGHRSTPYSGGKQKYDAYNKPAQAFPPQTFQQPLMGYRDWGAVKSVIKPGKEYQELKILNVEYSDSYIEVPVRFPLTVNHRIGHELCYKCKWPGQNITSWFRVQDVIKLDRPQWAIMDCD